MTATCVRRMSELCSRGRLWWLPADGVGNGLDDNAWAPILDVDARDSAPLLEALRAARVPAYTAALGHQHRTRTGPAATWPTYRIWVGTSRWAAGETCLLAVLPAYCARAGHEVVR